MRPSLAVLACAAVVLETGAATDSIIVALAGCALAGLALVIQGREHR